MRDVPVTTQDSKAFYRQRAEATCDDTKRQCLEELATEVASAYDRYDAVCPDVHTIATSVILDNTQKETLKDFYSRNQATLRADILAEWDAELRDSCPLCALGEPHTLDHYLPKTGHEEFVVHIPNLVPACGKCQGHKGTGIEEDGHRLTLHPAYDHINTYEILRCSIVFAQNPPLCTFQVIQPAGMPANLFQIAENHFKRLKLGDRYRKKGAAQLARELRQMRKRYQGGVSYSAIRDECKKEADNKSESYGGNYWETAFYVALAESLSERVLQVVLEQRS